MFRGRRWGGWDWHWLLSPGNAAVPQALEQILERLVGVFQRFANRLSRQVEAPVRLADSHHRDDPPDHIGVIGRVPGEPSPFVAGVAVVEVGVDDVYHELTVDLAHEDEV